MTYTYSEQLYSDLYKDARGYRPTAENIAFWDSLTQDSKQSYWDSLILEMEANEENVRKQKARAETEFESEVEKLLKLGAVNRDAAISIMVHFRDDKEYIYGDPDYLCFLLHLPYNYLNGVKIVEI